MRISDWSSDVCSSDLQRGDGLLPGQVQVVTGMAATLGRVEQAARLRRVQGRQERGQVDGATADEFVPRVDEGADEGRSHLLVPPSGHGNPSRTCVGTRSDEHTSELQSLMRISYAVF